MLVTNKLKSKECALSIATEMTEHMSCLIQHYNAVTMVCNTLIQSSLLGPSPKSIDFLDTKHHVSEPDSTSVFRQDAPNRWTPQIKLFSGLVSKCHYISYNQPAAPSRQ